MASLGSKAELFKTQAAQYAAFRPTYTDHLYQLISDFAGASRGLAVDLGCGSGQVAAKLARTYDRVIACDASEAQIAHAKPVPNVEYHCCIAEDLRGVVSSGAADLVTVGQALHWLDIPRFYREARRVLTPSGTLAAWGYSYSFFSPNANHSVETTAAANEALIQLNQGTLGPYWDEKRALVDSHYRGLEPAPEHFGKVARHEIEMTNTLTLAHYTGYLRSWSAYQTYKRAHPDTPDPVDAFKEHVLAVLGAESETVELDVRTPLFLILAKDPVPLESVTET